MKTITLRTIAFLLLSLSSIFADGFIVVPGPILPRRPVPRPAPARDPFPLEVKYHHVDVDIEGMAAVTAIDQEFHNPTSRNLEGYYIFPIPKGAVIKNFSMYINGKETHAEMLDAKNARKIYEDIVRRMIDPALLEYYQQGLFKARIFPIEPGSTKRVKISYSQILTKNNGTVEYVYPLNTEKFSAKPLNDVRILVNVKATGVIKNLYSTTHEAHIVRKGQHRAVVSWEDGNVKPDKDFNLYYKTDKSQLGLSLLTSNPSGILSPCFGCQLVNQQALSMSGIRAGLDEGRQMGYFLMNISPDDLSIQNQVQEKDIVFVLDVSGSMAGKKMEQAKKALSFCVENINKGDRFDIIRFATEAEALFGSLTKVNKGSRARARKFINDLRAVGGTNIEEALELALKQRGEDGRPYTVLFITDGKPTIGQTGEKPLLDIVKNGENGGTRIFTFGIGNDINTHLLDKITNETRAYRTYITPDEDIEVKISDIFTKVQSPVFTDLELTVSGGVRISKMYPRKLPDLFKGSSITVLGRYTGSGRADIVVKGRMKGKVRAMEFTGNFVKTGEKNEFIPPLWAARRIGYLLDQIRLNGEGRELVDEVTQLAREHGVITPYTSYLILEDEDVQVRGRRMAPEDQTLRNVVPLSSAFDEDVRGEYEVLKKSKSGVGSVRASREIQSLGKSQAAEQVMQGKARLNYRDKAGSVKNIAAQVRNIRGRAFYNTGSVWIDSRIQLLKNINTRRICYASEEYFDLVKKDPDTVQFLFLGRNVRFVYGDSVIEIYE